MQSLLGRASVFIEIKELQKGGGESQGRESLSYLLSSWSGRVLGFLRELSRTQARQAQASGTVLEAAVIKYYVVIFSFEKQIINR